MSHRYYRYEDERLYDEPIRMVVKEVEMSSLLLDCGVPKDYARRLCEDLSNDVMRCTEFSAHYLREYGGPSAREDDSILNFCRKWVTMKAASVIGVKKVVCRKNEEKDGILCVQRFLPSISAFRRYPYRQLYVPVEVCDQYAKEHKIEGGEIERKARYCHDTLFRLSFKEGKSVDKFHRDRAKDEDKEEPNITCFWLDQATAKNKGEYYKEGQDKDDIATVRGYLSNERILTTLVEHYKCHKVGEGSDARIYLEEQWKCLEYVGECLRILTSSLVPEDDIKRLSDEFTKAKHKLEHELADEQEGAIMACLRNRLSVISGPGGSGKSTIISALTEIFSKPETAVMAFTNKAVKVLRKNLGKYPNLRTIHMSMKHLDGDYSSKSYLRGKKNFIIDEAGQMSCGLFRKLLSAIIEANEKGTDYLKRCRIIMLGDHYQCGPIEWGYLFNFLVEHKEQEGRAFSRYTLTRDHRTKGGTLGFRKIAAELRNGTDARRIYSMLTKYEDGRTIYYEVKSGDAKAKVEECLHRYEPDKIILSSRKSIGTYNRMARDFHNNKHHFRAKRSYRDKNGELKDCDYAPGDKVKMVENVYAAGLYTGDEGEVTKVDRNGITCVFDGTEHLFLYEEKGEEKKESHKLYCKHLDYSYCETIYSSQGSEYDTVLIVADNRIDRDQLYTALTRAKKRCIVVDIKRKVKKDDNGKWKGKDGNEDHYSSPAIEYFLPKARNDKTLDLTFL